VNKFSNLNNMRKIIVVLGIVGSILACRTEENLPPEPGLYDYYPGKATAVKDDQEWKAIAGSWSRVSSGEEFLSLRLGVYTEYEENREVLFVENIPLVIQENPIHEEYISHNRAWVQGTFHTLIADDDVLDKSYRVLGDSSYITVTAYDPVTKMIEGEFEITFIIDERWDKPTYTSADTLRFRQGRFKVPVGQPGEEK